MIGLMTSQVMFLSRIATATESLAGTGGVLSPIGAGGPARSIDSALAAAAMSRRAAVGAPRTPSPI
jgi:hypothetical protein